MNTLYPKLITRCLIFLFFTTNILFASPISDQFDQLVTSGFGGVEYGSTDEHGDYILAVSMLEVSSGTDMSMAIETARIIAQRDLAEFLGTKMSSKTEVKTTSLKTTINGETKKEVKKFFSDFIKTETNQLLRGATVFDSYIDENKIFVGFLLSQKFTKDAAELASLASSGSGGNISFGTGIPTKNDLRVEAIGMAAIRNGNISEAREDAMAKARRNAVEHAMGVTVVATGQVKNIDPNSAKFKNFSHSLGEVLRTKVLFEGQENNFYKIKIAALVTAADFSRELGKYMAAIGNPLFYVDRSSGTELADEFSEFFKDLGFKLTDSRLDADYFIKLKSKFIERKHPLTFKVGTQLQVTIEVVDPYNQKVLLVERNNPRASTNFLSDPDRRRQIVAERALLSMENSLKNKVGKLIADMVQNGRELKIEFQSSENLGSNFIDFVSDQIEWVPGASNLYSESSLGSISFEINYIGSVDLLRNTLEAELTKFFTTKKFSLTIQRPNQLHFLIH